MSFCSFIFDQESWFTNLRQSKMMKLYQNILYICIDCFVFKIIILHEQRDFFKQCYLMNDYQKLNQSFSIYLL